MVALLVTPDAETAAQAAADHIAIAIAERFGSASRVHVALAGGGTPRRAYEILAGLRDDWTGVHLWFGDERVVSLDSDDANAHMVNAALVTPAGLPRDQVHTVPTHLGPRGACDAYTAELRHHAGDPPGRMPVLDVAVLGLGEDAHTASLFPASPALNASDEICVVVEDAPKPPPTRVSLTMAVLNAARARIVLATGFAKAPAVAASLGEPDVNVPASMLSRAATTWILDEAAASDLPRNLR